MTSTLVELLKALPVMAVATVMVARIAARGNARTEHVKAVTAPYAELSDQVGELIASNRDLWRELNALKAERLVDREWIRTIVLWAAVHGHQLPVPPPQWTQTAPTAPHIEETP